jgi:hypothetical protein
MGAENILCYYKKYHNYLYFKFLKEPNIQVTFAASQALTYTEGNNYLSCFQTLTTSETPESQN